MKKLAVSKILILVGFSVSLMACGAIQDKSTESSDLSSLKAAPRTDGGNQAPISKVDGGNQVSVEDGGNQSSLPDGGNQLSLPDGGNQLIEIDDGGNQVSVEDGGNQSSLPDGGNQLSPPDGGNQLHVELYDNVLLIKGEVSKDVGSVGLIINGKEQYKLEASNLMVEAKFELTDEDLKEMSIHLVEGKNVLTFMILNGKVQAVKY